LSAEELDYLLLEGGRADKPPPGEPHEAGHGGNESAVQPVPPPSESVRVRAIWALQNGSHLTVGLVPVTAPPSTEPTIFDFRTGDDSRLRAVLALYGWSGRQIEGGTFVAFFAEVDVILREHVFDGGEHGRVVSSALPPVQAQAS